MRRRVDRARTQKTFRHRAQIPTVAQRQRRVQPVVPDALFAACGVFLPAFLRHGKQWDARAAGRIEPTTRLTTDAWIDLLGAVMPPCGVHLNAAAIDALVTRYEGNKGIARSPGEVTSDTLRAILNEVYG